MCISSDEETDKPSTAGLPVDYGLIVKALLDIQRCFDGMHIYELCGIHDKSKGV